MAGGDFALTQRREAVIVLIFTMRYCLVRTTSEVLLKSTPKSTRLVMAVLCVLVGLFLIAIAPRIIQTSLERVLVELLETIVEQPRYASGITLFSFFYPLWRALGFVAGVTLIAIATPLYRGGGMGIRDRPVHPCHPVN